jgi:hypothetical protein
METHQAEIMELLGQWKSQADIIKIMYDKYNYRIHPKYMIQYYQENQEKVDKMRNEWKDNIENMDVVHKRGRLEKLVYILKTQMEKYEEGKEYSINRSRECRAVIEQIRKEVEGDKISIDVNGSIDINASIMMNQTIQQLTRKVNIGEWIVALVAAKRGLNPTTFMHDLATGFYAAHNGFAGKPKEGGGVKYPSELLYNWEEIGEKHNNPKKDDDIEDAVEVRENEKGDLRAKMMKIMSARIPKK